MVPVKTLAAIRKVKLDWEALDRWNNGRKRNLYFVTREAEAGGDFHARYPVRGAGDDPVTGSSGGCAIAWLVQHGPVASGKKMRIEQGLEVQRGGEMVVSAEKMGGAVKNVRVGGVAVRSLHGKLEVE